MSLFDSHIAAVTKEAQKQKSSLNSRLQQKKEKQQKVCKERNVLVSKQAEVLMNVLLRQRVRSRRKDERLAHMLCFSRRVPLNRQNKTSKKKKGAFLACLELVLVSLTHSLSHSYTRGLIDVCD